MCFTKAFFICFAITTTDQKMFDLTDSVQLHRLYKPVGRGIKISVRMFIGTGKTSGNYSATVLKSRVNRNRRRLPLFNVPVKKPLVAENDKDACSQDQSSLFQRAFLYDPRCQQ